ncbi:SWIM zinc finger family protein, partial [Streptomyces daliensis]|nr:SWIM zinc finger family protein [Streptomyces daliensis]
MMRDGSSPSAPRSSSSPSRTLAPLAPDPGSRGPFARSWWGNAWVRAMEEGSSIDPGRLSRGRTYARGGNVDAITVTAGRIVAQVHGSRSRPYRAEVRLRTFGDAEWEALLDAVAARPARIAALLAKDMPGDLVTAAEEAGVRLLPDARELDWRCSCPDRGHPCKHAAALCYRAAHFLDADPFVLLLMRGREEGELLDELARRNTARAADAPPASSHAEGVGAREAFATAVRAPLPDPLPVAAAPGQPPLFPDAADVPDASGAA